MGESEGVLMYVCLSIFLCVSVWTCRTARTLGLILIIWHKNRNITRMKISRSMECTDDVTVAFLNLLRLHCGGLSSNRVLYSNLSQKSMKSRGCRGLHLRLIRLCLSFQVWHHLHAISIGLPMSKIKSIVNISIILPILDQTSTTLPRPYGKSIIKKFLYSHGKV